MLVVVHNVLKLLSDTKYRSHFRSMNLVKMSARCGNSIVRLFRCYELAVFAASGHLNRDKVLGHGGSREKVPATNAVPIPQESTAYQWKSKATIDCGAKKAGTAKESRKMPLTDLCALWSSPPRKIGPGGGIGDLSRAF
jgi:hypothetical protein